MDPRRWKRIEELFEAARQRPADERSAFLERECGDDAELLREVAELLVHDTEADATLIGVVAEVAGDAAPVEHAPPLDPGRHVGRYRIEREIGRGGMGTVYLAVRDDDEYRKQVAIKIMHHRGNRDDLLRRFQTERQILATLEHPNIARLLDGGTTDGGEPYVVMEYVEGQSLDAYCDGRRLGTRARLRLFRMVCDAVQYAHRNLVVHRDIKPGNILVTAEGTPKLLDFGIAKLLDPQLVSHTLAETAMDSRLLTPEYASPEQIQGGVISTATDVYSLGVLLYELLTGRRPYRLTRVSTGELERAIVEQDPERPSTAILRRETSETRKTDPQTIGRQRGTAPERLRKQLTGDLDNIVLTALRKQPERRYDSAEALSLDIRRHLDGLPVDARPRTLGYRMQKFVRRNLAAVASAVSVLAVIAFLVSFYTIQLRDEAQRARAAEQRAVGEARVAEATAEFLINLFDTADPRQAGRRDVNAEDLVHAGLERLRTDDSLDPATRAELRLTLGLCLSNLGLHEAGAESIRLSGAEREQLFGRESLETAEGLHRLGDVLRRAQHFDEGLALLSEALEIRERLLDGDTYELADSYNNLAIMVVNLGELAESDRLQTRSVEMHTRITGPDSQQVAVPLNNLALLKRRQGRLDEAEELSRRAREILDRGTDRSSALRARSHVAVVQSRKGMHTRALAEHRVILDEQVDLLGPTHRVTLATARNITNCLIFLGRLEEAREQIEELLSVIVQSSGVDSTLYASTRLGLALMERMEGRPDRAEMLMREVLRTYVENTGPRHFILPGRRRQLAEALIATGKHDEAGSLLEQALAGLPEPGEYPHVERARVLIRLGQLRLIARDADGAAEAFAAARAILDQTSGENSLEMGQLLVRVAELELAGGDLSVAVETLRRAEATLARFVPEAHPDRREASRLLEKATR